MRKVSSAALLMAVSATVGWAGSARADNIANYGVYGNSNVTFGGFVTIHGDGGSNGDIDHTGAILTANDLYAAGDFDGTSATQSVSGAVVVDGNFYGGGLSTYGSIDAGGSIALQGNVTGNVTAAQNLSLSTFNTVGGNALAGGNATLAGVNTIGGTLGADGNLSSTGGVDADNVWYGGTLSLASGSSYASISHTTMTIQPRGFSTLPFNQTTFSSGGALVSLATFANTTLAPGSYGALMFNGANTLNLSSGNYYFSSIQSLNAFTTINYNLNAGPINIFVTGNIDLLSMGFEINFQSLSSLGASAEPLASEIYLESHGNVTFDNVPPSNGSQFFGTIYAPDGAIDTGVNESFYGSLIGQTVDIQGATIYSEPSEYLAAESAPEPSTVAVLFAALLPLTVRRRRR